MARMGSFPGSGVAGLMVRCGLLLWCGLAWSDRAPAAAPPRPPNVVLIISDDQHWRDYGFQGHPHLRTPHLDRLARESLVFTRGSVPSSLCCPSLASIITGRYPHEHRIVGNDPPELPDTPHSSPAGQAVFEAGRARMNAALAEWPTLPRLLSAAGYRSLQTGKWWQGHFSHGGFDEGMTQGGRHGDDGLVIGRQTMQPAFEFMARCREESRPFLLWYAPLLPHTPHDPPQELVDHYRSQTDSVPVARYWGNVERFDRTVGELLDRLDHLGIADETLVIYVTDNGWLQDPAASRFAARSKLSPYDGGLRTPIMLRQPGVIAPRQSAALASSLDIVPTVLAACGVEPPAGLPGVNLLDDAAAAARRQVFGECFTHTIVDLDDPARSLLWRWTVRCEPDGRPWKLIVPATADGASGRPSVEPRVADPAARTRHERGEVELFDLAADPDETRNVAAEHPDLVTALGQSLDAWWTPVFARAAAATTAAAVGGDAPPERPARLLCVSVTTGFRHASIPTAEAALEEIGRTSGLFHLDFLRMPAGRRPQPKPPKRAAGMSDAAWAAAEADFQAAQETFRREDEVWQQGLREQFVRAFSAESLSAFDGLVFASTTGDLPIPDIDGMLGWIKAGKAFIGFHAASDTLKSSDAYVEMIGGHFAGHPWNAGGEHGFVVHDTRHPAAAMFPERFRWKDEIYQYDPRYRPDNLRVLLSIDMAASTPKEPWHVPVAWVREYGRGRVFYSNFGHNEATWGEPMFRRHFQEGIAWALGRTAGTAAPNPEVQAAEYLRSVVAAAAAATGVDGDALRATADATIARDPTWAVGLRPKLLELRSVPPAERAARYAEVIAAIEGSESAAVAAPPNVVVILADDLGFSDLGCYGGEIDTPHLDRLAAGGLRFTQGYNTARCWPTRGALLTGYYAQAIRRDASPGIKGGRIGYTRPAWARLLPEYLALAGYRSYHSGKWHIDGEPLAQGFQRSLRIEGGQNDYFDLDGVTVDGKPLQPGDPLAGSDFYVTTAVGEHAAACLRDHRAHHAGTPFFSYVAFTAPHFPLQAPQDVIAKYRERYLAGWDAVRQARFERLGAADMISATLSPLEPQVGSPSRPHADVLARLGPGEIDHQRPWAALTSVEQEFQATKMAIHAAMIEMMDRAVGRIVAELEALDALDDTLILFLSDNGASAEIMIRGKGHDPALPPGASGSYLCLGPGWSNAANTPFRRHKQWVHEGGIATPWIVHWPRGIADPDTLRTQPVHVIDVVPTVLELAGLAMPTEHDGRPVPPLHGRSFTACLRDPAGPPPHETLWWCHNGHRAVRTGDWKLVADRDGPWELYDLARDRTETVDLAGGQPERVAALEQAWVALNGECRELAHADAPPAAPPPPAASRPSRPNIIYVMTDDQGYGDIASHGNPVIQTPHLDRMRNESVRLTEFHVSPTCAPTRAALLTGRHEFRSGVTHTIFERERLALSAVTLPQLLRRAGGYTTGIFGKWHLGDEDDYQPGTRGFDRVFIHGGGGIGQRYPGSCGDAPGNTYFNPVIRSDGTFVKTQGYCTDVFFDAALAWIDACRKNDKPFFCYLATNAPHAPLECPPGSDAKYLAPLEAAGIADPQKRADIAKFYGMIENIDTNMGKLLGKLDDWGLAEDTLVVFTTDNGTATGASVWNDGMRGRKGTVYRGGTRVPAYWRWRENLPAGMDVSSVTAHIDVLPTVCDIAGVELPPAVAEKIEGRSFALPLRGARIAWPDRQLVTHLGRWDRGRAAESAYRSCRIREGRWQLVNTRNAPTGWELYDLEDDPGEERDVASRHPDVVARLAADYDRWWASVQGDLVNEDLDGPAENPFQTAFQRQFGSEPTPADVRAGAAAPPLRRPNVVLFLCDDLGTGDISALGSRDIRTPCIDALFARGTRLTRHWAGSAVCAPSRCVLLTGKHPGHAAVRSNRMALPEGQAPLPAGTVTVTGLLREAGYATGGFGKWGLGPPGSDSDPVACGFDWFFGFNCQREAHSFYPGHLWDNRDRIVLDNGDVPRKGTLEPPATAADFAQFRGRHYAADLIAEQQLAFIRAHAARPFFLYVPTTVPHLALQVPADEPSLAMYEAHFGAEDPYLGGRGYVPCERPLATYAAMITRMDREVGRIVGLLDDLGLTDDTIFVFTSDNGATMPGTGGIDTARLASNGSLRDWKESPYEGGLRVPATVVWPGKIPAGAVLDAPTGFEDWLPTLLDLTGLPDLIPPDADGVSLAAALTGSAPLWRDRDLYRELTERQWQAVLAADGRWKAVRRAAGTEAPGPAAPTELYDLAADPGETADIAADHPDVVRRLEAVFEREHVPDPAWLLAFTDAPGPPPQPAAAGSGRRPNILFVIVDDQSPFELQTYDPTSPLATPVIDRLAAEGIVIDAAYHMGSFSGAVCVPSRHMLMTGRSVWHLPIGPGAAACPPRLEEATIPAVFNSAGYDTMRTCKRENCYEAASRQFTVRHDATRRGGTPEEGSAWHADRVLEYLAERERTTDPDPFLIYLGFSHPHDTRDGTPELLATYGATNHTDETAPPPLDSRQPPLPLNWLPRHPFDTTHLDVRDEVAVSGIWRRRDEATIRNELGREYACSANIDRELGRVLERLASLGELENTWVFYTSDHGIAIGRHGLHGKQNLYEHTWRVPFIVKGPGVKPGSRAAGNIYLADTLATLCDICGIEPPASNEGTSFLPVLRGTQETIRDVLSGVYSGGRKPGIRSVRKGDWKLIKYESPSGGLHTQLFNLRDNPHEFLAEHHDPAIRSVSQAAAAPHQKNLADDPTHAPVRRDLENLLLAEMHERGDPHRFSDQPPPNVVVIFIDDLGYGDIGPFGATGQQTPNLDRMAAEGLKLTSFYAAPACSVSRAQLLTGCYGLRVGVPSVYAPASPNGLHPAEVTIAERLAPLGYATACIGKWHLGDQPEFLPTRQGFDRYYGIPYSNDMQLVSAETGARVVPLLRDEQVEELLTDEMQPAIVEKCTAEAVRFIEESKDRPFFLYMPHTAVHAPIVPGKRFEGRSRNGRFGDWVEEVDWSVGQILDTLGRLGLERNTLVFFTSDNGPWVGVVGPATTAGPLRGSKGSTWEGGVRVPTLAWWPGRIAPGTTCDTVAGTIDLLPTLVTLAGGTVPAEPVLDGRDMSGLLFGTSTESPREAHYYFLRTSLEAVRRGPWKLAVAPQESGSRMPQEQPPEPASLERPRLYDLAADIGETTDVAAVHPEIVADLSARAVAMQRELGDPASPARRPAGSVADPQTLYPTVPQPPRQPTRTPAATKAAARSRPNIVLFLADDLGYGELGCFGNRQAVTPHLDRFAATGVRLTDCHSASSCCSPSRSSLLTGRMPYRNGVFTWIPEQSPIHLRASEITLPTLLKSAGYDTCHVGKWHLNGIFNAPEQPQPGDHGYDWWLATQNNAAPSHAFPVNFVRNGTAIGKVDDYSAPFIAREAVNWLTTKRDPEKPFFLAVWAHEPHYPIASAERYERLHAGITDPETRTYRANVTQLDDAFGAVMRALERLGVADDTLVFFTSDNGPEGEGDKGPGRGLAGDLRGRKRSMYEGGHRVPGIIRWPDRLPAGMESSLAMIGSDFFPTALAAAGVAAPAGVTLDGVNLLPCLAGDADAAVERKVPMCWRWGGRVAYREGNWKLVTDEGFTTVELYDLAADVRESSDVASGEQERLGAMRGRLERLLAEIEAEGPDWWRTEPMNGLRRPSTLDAGKTIGETGGGAQGYP